MRRSWSTRLIHPAFLAVVYLVAACGGPATEPSGSPPSTSPALSVPAAELVDGHFDVDGRSMYLRCEGKGSPTVILEPGDGDPSTSMDPLRAGLTDEHRICVYDRANKGLSDPAPFGRPMTAMADDLAALLAAAGETGPFLPVGTSLGGVASYLFAARHPDMVTGFVAINPPEDPDLWLPAVKPLLDDAAYADEVAYGTGTKGTERYDGSGWLAAGAPPDSMPYRILDSSSEQCEGDPICLSVYDVIIAQTRDIAARGAGGRWLQIPGSHQLQVSNTADVLEQIQTVLDEAIATDGG